MKNTLFIVGAAGLALVLAIAFAWNTSSTVEVSHVINAPVDRVWVLWNEPESMKRWWGPKHYTAPDIANDLREGGIYLLAMQAPDGKVHRNVGRYTEIIEKKKLVSQMAFADEAGKAIPASAAGLPGKWPDEITVTVEFEDLGDKTKVTVTETGIPSIMYIFAKMGWKQQFAKIDQMIEN
ncbi:MAG: SRPBCC domain-containing protein [Bdellovibrionales bacterium]|nr:SRPBCC domain-containing protein [Bdellovibrionales bacterium]